MQFEKMIDDPKIEIGAVTGEIASEKNITRRYGYLKEIFTGLLGAAVLVTSIVAYIPLNPGLPDDSLDGGWTFALNEAVAKGLVFGRDVIFTFGPYGSVYTCQFNPATNIMMFGGRALMAAAFGLILLCICKGYARIFAVALTLFLLLVLRDNLFFALPLVALILIYRVSLPSASPDLLAMSPGVKFTLVLMLLALGMQPLIKGTFGICSLIVVFCAFAILCGQRRFIWAFSMVSMFVVWLALLWILAGQPLQYLPSFFLTQLPIISGYSQAMSIYGPRWQIDWFLAGGLAIWLLGNLRFRADGAAGLALAIGSGLILFLGFKEGFVRDDGHSFIAGGLLGVSGLAFALFRRTPIAVACCAIGLITFIIVNENQFGLIQSTSMRSNIGTMVKTITGDLKGPFEQAAFFIELQVENKHAIMTEYDASLSAIRAVNVLPPISGPTDIYSFGQSVLLADGLEWDPRPVLQSYSAYTPTLLEKDANHLAGPHAPTNILFAIQAIDGRLPSLEDGASWPALLNNYMITGIYDNFVLLRRRPQALAAAPVAQATIMTGTYRLGEMVPLSANAQSVWSQIDIQPTLLGRAFGLLFKPPNLNILYAFPDGRRQEFRYIAGMGQTGFLLSPLIQSTRDFAVLTYPDSKRYFFQRQPSSISLSADYGAGLLWHSRFSLKLYSVAIPVQTNLEGLLFSPLQIDPPRAIYPVTPSCAIDRVNGSFITQQPVKVGAFLEVDGWAAISAESGLAAARTSITLTAADGSRQSALAKQTSRTDVARFYRQPALDNAGFDIVVELSPMSGPHTLGIEVSSGDKTYSCAIEIPIDIQPQIVATKANPASN